MEAVCTIHYLSGDQIQQMSNVGLYPPQLSYLVDGTFASGSQDCKILIRGADVNGQDLFFVLALNQSLSLKSGKHFYFVDSSGS